MVSYETDEDVRRMLAFRAGDEKAFETLLARYETPVLNFVFRFTGNAGDAEDIVQEAFLRIYRARDTYEPKAKFSTWLYRITANLALDWKKKKGRDLLGRAESAGRREDEEDRERELQDLSEKSVEASIEQMHVDEQIRYHLSLLPENQRLALTLKVFEGKSYEEIADILNTSVAAVESLLFRARQTLRHKLTRAVR